MPQPLGNKSRITLASLLAACGLLLATSTIARADTISVDPSSQLTVTAFNGVGNYLTDAVSQSLTPASPDYTSTQTATDTTATSTGTYSILNTPGHTTISIDMLQSRPGTQDAFAESSGDILFTVDRNATYIASGNYGAIDTGNHVELDAALYEPSTGDQLFNSEQVTEDVPNQQFTLGGTKGPDYFFGGSLSGTLLPGHVYDFFHTADTQAANGPDAGATARGNLTLQITYVPLPNSALAGLSLLAAAGLTKLRRPRTSLV